MKRRGTVALGASLLAAPLIVAAMPQVQSAPAGAPSSIVVEIDGLRSNKGQIMACMTANPKTFPDCQKDPNARHFTVPALKAETVQFKDGPPGRHATARPGTPLHAHGGHAAPHQARRCAVQRCIGGGVVGLAG